MSDRALQDEQAARRELERRIQSRATGEDILNSLLPLEQEAAEQTPTIPAGEHPSEDFWDARVYAEDRSFEALLTHLENIAAAYAKAPPRAERRAVLIIGPPASGKSTIAEPMARALAAAIVDPDDASEHIPEYQSGKCASAVHHEAGLIAIHVLARFVNRGANVILPKIGGSSPMTERLVRILTRAGYAVVVVHLSVSFDETVRRMARRFLESGRMVQADYIREVGTKTRNTFAHLKRKGIAHGAIEIDAEDIARQRIVEISGDIWPELRTALGGQA